MYFLPIKIHIHLLFDVESRTLSLITPFLIQQLVHMNFIF